MKSHEIAIEPENRLQQRMLFRLRPSSRVCGHDQKLAFGDNGRQGMQELHPRRQGSCLRNKYGVHGGRSSKGHGKPENCASNDQQCTPRREAPAFAENPSHSAFECVMNGFLESLIAYLLPKPQPTPAHKLAPLFARLAGNRQASDDTL